MSTIPVYNSNKVWHFTCPIYALQVGKNYWGLFEKDVIDDHQEEPPVVWRFTMTIDKYGGIIYHLLHADPETEETIVPQFYTLIAIRE